LLPSVSVGIVSGILVIILQISFAALIFSGELTDQLSYGVGIVLFGASVIGAVAAMTSSYPGTVACLQGSPAVVLALMAGAVVAGMPASATPETKYFTVIAALGMVSFFSGILFWGLGRFKLGSLIRFVPYPVSGGFLAGTGLFLLIRAICVMTESSIGFSGLPQVFQSQMIMKWLPGVIFAVVLLFFERRYRHYLIMPTIIMIAIAIFFLALALTEKTIPDVRSQGLLLNAFPSGSLWRPLGLSAWNQVNWTILLGQAGQMGTVFVIGLISLLLNASGLELIVKRDIDLNRELRSTGIANMLSGIGSGPIGYLALSLSVLGHKMKSTGRLAGFISAALCVVPLFIGASLFSFLPRFVLGGLLFFLGLSFLIEWLYDAWFKMPKTDYIIVVLILLVIGFRGFLDGVGMGLIIAVILFVIKYSGIDVVKQTLSGTTSMSNVDRPVEHLRLLRQRGGEVFILRLQGYIFFGTAHNLYRKVRGRTRDAELAKLRFIVFDFTRVTGLDSSAEVCFAKMVHLARSQRIMLVFTQINPTFKHQLNRTVFTSENKDVFLIFPDQDHGIEWCEDQILTAEKVLPADEKQSLRAQLKKSFPRKIDVDNIIAYLERREVDGNYCLMRQGEPSDGLYFIESGQVIAQLSIDGRSQNECVLDESGSEKSIRLRVMRPGAVVGEISLYLGGPRTATAVTTKPSVLYRLSSEALQRMEEEDPETASAFHQFIARLLAERLSDNSRTIQALYD
jgi:SulP family sulfate permease